MVNFEEAQFEEQMNMLCKSNAQLSAHTIDGWYGMYLRMMRFYNRAKNSENNTDELDFYIVFFQNCFHEFSGKEAYEFIRRRNCQY